MSQRLPCLVVKNNGCVLPAVWPWNRRSSSLTTRPRDWIRFQPAVLKTRYTNYDNYILSSWCRIVCNKRLGWLATAVFLELNGIEATGISNDDVHDLVMSVASGAHDVDEIAQMLHRALDRR